MDREETSRLGAMEARLAQLERDNRRLRRGLAGGVALPVLLVAALASAGWKQEPRDVEARTLKIVNAKGKIITVVSEDGLSLFDPSGKVRAIFGVVDGAPTLGLLDNKGEVRAALGVSNSDESSLTLNDKAGNPTVSLAATTDTVGVVLTSPTKKGDLTLGVGPGGPAISLRDAAGKEVKP